VGDPSQALLDVIPEHGVAVPEQTGPQEHPAELQLVLVE
jgi:hypothetical protein